MAACLGLTGYDWTCSYFQSNWSTLYTVAWSHACVFCLQTTVSITMICVTLSSRSWCSKVTGRPCPMPSLSAEKKLFLRKLLKPFYCQTWFHAPICVNLDLNIFNLKQQMSTKLHDNVSWWTERQKRQCQNDWTAHHWVNNVIFWNHSWKGYSHLLWCWCQFPEWWPVLPFQLFQLRCCVYYGFELAASLKDLESFKVSYICVGATGWGQLWCSLTWQHIAVH